jgi:hypothetical protein
MCDENESVSIAVNRKPVHSSGHHGAVSGVMSLMCNVCTSGKFGGCSEEPSWDGTSWGACEHACWDSEARRSGLGSNGESEKRPEDGRKVQGGQTGSAECVCDRDLQLQNECWVQVSFVFSMQMKDYSPKTVQNLCRENRMCKGEAWIIIHLTCPSPPER